MQAKYYDGSSAAGETVEIRVDLGCLTIVRLNGSSERWEAKQFRPRASASDTRLRIEKHPYCGEYLEVTGGAEAQELALLLHVDRGVRKCRTLWLAGALAAVAALIAGAAYLTQDVVFSWAAALAPSEAEERLGAAVMRALAPPDQRLSGDGIEKPLARIVSRLGGAAGGSRFRVTVVNSELVNAWAAPGGYVGVNCGLVKKMQSGDELAAVLAHEFQHVVRRHATKNLLRTVVLRFGLSMIGGGDFDGWLDVAGVMGALKFMRGDEAEADRGGLELLVRARIDPRAMARAFERLDAAASDMPSAMRYLSSHTPTKERRRLAEDRARQIRGEYRPVLSGPEFAAFRDACVCREPRRQR